MPASNPSSRTGIVRPGRRREKYTRMACETCKIRKVKCSGQSPCSRCIELGAECIYHETPTASSPTSDKLVASGRIAKPRRRPSNNFNNPDLGQLVVAMKKVCDDIESSASSYGLAAIPLYSLKRSQQHRVGGCQKVANPVPSYVHLLGMAQEILEQKGLLETSTNPAHHIRPSTANGADVTTPTEDLLQAAKPILHLGRARALRYLSTFKDHVYSAYPCINLSVATERISALYGVCLAQAEVDASQGPGLDLIDIEIMKATFAIAMILDGENDNPLCHDLTTHLLWSVDNKMVEEQSQIEDIIMATLLAIYWTLQDQPLKAWRMISFAATTCLELGLHKERPTEESDQPPFVQLRELFSSVYDLDKRCSFYANLPWTLHHNDIGANVMNLGDRHPFLSVMLSLDRVHTEITRFNTSAPPGGGRETDEQTEIFDYRVQKLVESTFAKGLFPLNAPYAPPLEIQNALSSILQLRAIQVRMLAYRHYLSNRCDGSSYKDQAMQVLISLATSSVDVYLRISRTSLLWRSLADRLLMDSTSCMFLAASQDPCKYGPLCRNAFHTAVDCLGQSSYKLTESESELWCSLDDLRRLGRKIQMPPLQKPSSPKVHALEDFTSVTGFDGHLHFSPEELAQLCDNTGQEGLSDPWDASSLWDNQFNEFEVI